MPDLEPMPDSVFNPMGDLSANSAYDKSASEHNENGNKSQSMQQGADLLAKNPEMVMAL